MKKLYVLMALALTLILLPACQGQTQMQEVEALRAKVEDLEQKLTETETKLQESHNVIREKEENAFRLYNEYRDVVDRKNDLVRHAGSSLTLKELEEFGKILEYEDYLLPTLPVSMGITLPHIDLEAIRQFVPEDMEPLTENYVNQHTYRSIEIGKSTPVKELMLTTRELDALSYAGYNIYEHWTIGQFKSYQRYALTADHAFTREFEGKRLYSGDTYSVHKHYLQGPHTHGANEAVLQNWVKDGYRYFLKESLYLIENTLGLPEVFKKQ